MIKNTSIQTPTRSFVRSLMLALGGGVISLFLASCANRAPSGNDSSHVIEISVPQQKMAVYRDGSPIKYFPISTSKFGLGDVRGSKKTPLGKFEVAQKIGGGKPKGAVFKGRKWTGEVVKPNSPGRDPIVSRIFWLKGKERQNKDAYNRYIYIHGTPEEKNIGRPASYGCIRMKSKDVIDLYKTVGEGANVFVVNKPLWRPETKRLSPPKIKAPAPTVPQAPMVRPDPFPSMMPNMALTSNAAPAPDLPTASPPPAAAVSAPKAKAATAPAPKPSLPVVVSGQVRKVRQFKPLP